MLRSNFSGRLAVLILCAASSVCSAAEGSKYFGGDPASDALIKEADQAYKNKDYARWDEKLRAFLKLNPLDWDAYYNLANAEVLCGKKEAAFAELGKSADLGFYDVEHLKTDADFAYMHGDKRWDAIAVKVQDNDRIVHVLPQEIKKSFDHKDFKQVLQKCDELSNLDPKANVSLHRAKACAMLGMKDDAFASLGKAVDSMLKSKDVIVSDMLKDPLLENLASDKRFVVLVARARAAEKSRVDPRAQAAIDEYRKAHPGQTQP